ncbi:MAG TPA: tetratricopeptide repeat protein, partial [Gemmatimonadaceae bacterium]|nr:tetratricopeptide repeat protein [Gemmatimonadaceae bacterium]
MSNIAKLKKKAAELEAKKQYEKALEVYEQVLNTARTSDEDRDVPLYNRVGDLHYRIGNNERAITYYEQAADLYADGGFFNNAIALCNKILRYSPGRTVVYYKLGIISAKKGFTSDAKQNFLEYADRMQRVGKMDEAFRALKEFADLCPGQDDVRLMLADQLARANRKDEALEQLELLYDALQSEGRSSEATATLERIRVLDPAFKPRRSVTPRARKKEGLVFLDLEFDSPMDAETPGEFPDSEVSRGGSEVRSNVTEPVAAESSVAATPPAGLELTSLDEKSDADPTPRDPSPAAHPANELKFISSPEPPSEVTQIAPLDLAPLIDSLPTSEPGTVELPHDYDSPSEPGPRVIDFPIGRTPARETTPVADASVDPLRGLSILPDAEPVRDTDEAKPDDGSDAEEGYIDLGEWLERTRTPPSTRMITHDEEPETDEQKDFGEMLDKFKAGISRNVDDEDFESHYDLGIAFREMGLLDEAIGSFQKASRGKDQRVRASEAIGQCFMDKGEAGVTMTVLERLVSEPGMSDTRLVGVLYLLGQAAESLGRTSEAAAYFQRVLAVQIGFRD